jgi:hypothetical protein
MQQLQQQMQRQQGVEGAYRNALMSPEQVAMQGNGGPTNAAAAAIPNSLPQLNQAALLRGLAQVDPMRAAEMLQPKPDELMTVAPGASIINKRDPSKPVYTAPKEQSLPQDWQLYQLSGAAARGVSFDDWNRANKKSGAASISQSMNAGQKGYENESKLRNDFKSEPIYKDFQDMQAAHKQIKAGIAQGTPIGDVATATKIMKLLDPGSVVRESELGIAMAAGGRMDRLQNYVQMQLSGEKLTPKMRDDFGKLADELYKAAAQSYNKKRGEYEHLGQRYGLDPSVLGAPGAMETSKVRKFNPATGRIE